MPVITRLVSVLAVATVVTAFAPPAQAQPPTSSAPSKAGPSQVLEQKPWGQDVLRFDEIERFGLTGRTQKVAVIDTGVHPHNYLGERLKGGGDYVARGGDGLEDCDGHGTEVAGIIAANPNNPDIGFRGIAPQAKILSIRQSSANYEFTNPTTNKKEAAGSLTTAPRRLGAAARGRPVTLVRSQARSRRSPRRSCGPRPTPRSP